MTKTALIVIDVQESFRQQASWASISNPEIAHKAGLLVQHARAARDAVYWVLHSEPGSNGPFDPVNGWVKLHPGLQRREGEPLIVKGVHNCFTDTDLHRQLTRNGVTRLRLAGIRTEQCVESSARVASDLGYEVAVVIDATATHPLPLADGSGVLEAKDVIDRTAAALQGRFADVTTIDQVVAT